MPRTPPDTPAAATSRGQLSLFSPAANLGSTAGTHADGARPPLRSLPAEPPSTLGASDDHPHRLFHHPRGNRNIRFGEHRVQYELRRARRRTIGFIVGEEGLVVAAPRWVGQVEIDAALVAKARWILRKLMDQGERQTRLEAARVDWRDGAELPYLGEPLVVVLDARVDGAVLDDSAAASPGLARRALRVGLPQTAEPAQIRDAVQSWLQRQALSLFDERCRLYAARLGVRVKRLKLSSARTRWGSATADGTVRLHWRLVHFALATIDYVVAHELAHLREMNHSPAFWEVVRSVMPDYERARGALKSDTLPVFE